MAARRKLPTVPDPSIPALPQAVTSAIGFLANEVAAVFRFSFEQVLLSHRLRPRQYLLLLVLRDEGPMPQHVLGQRLGMDRTSAMQALQFLEDSGMVRREDDPDDRRVYRVSLTPEGRRLTATLEGRIKRAETEVLAPLSEKERIALAAQLRAILGSQHTGSCPNG